MLPDPIISVLGQDPNRTHRINANSFQQHAITTIHSFQYCTFYTSPNPTSNIKKASTCFLNLARRQVLPEAGEWETFVLEDYEREVDDGHNTISIGVCSGDGTVHLGFDHHCDRISEPGLANAEENGRKKEWEASRFGKTQDFLPGIEHNALMDEVTYPRFVNVGDDMLLTWQIGPAGQGSDILFHYSSSTHMYTYLGQHLTGTSNSPYVNGIDCRLSRLHISWCYRNFVPVEPGTHKQQAGPNGPENNYDLCYTYSDDVGRTWMGSEGGVLAALDDGGEKRKGDETIRDGAIGARVFGIPINSGILSQEAQAADYEGGFWVLNRQTLDSGSSWMAYYRSSSGDWTSTPIPSSCKPTETGNRGSVCVSRGNDVYLVLPGNSDSSLTLTRAKSSDGYRDWETVWRGEEYDGEPCVDVGRLEGSEVLSVFTRTDGVGVDRSVVVLDFELE